MAVIKTDSIEFFNLILSLLDFYMNGGINVIDPETYATLEKLIRSKAVLRQHRLRNKELFQKLKILVNGLNTEDVNLIRITTSDIEDTGGTDKQSKLNKLLKKFGLKDHKELEEILDSLYEEASKEYSGRELPYKYLK